MGRRLIVEIMAYAIYYTQVFKAWSGWVQRGRPRKQYPGFRCVKCGVWCDTPVSIRDYEMQNRSGYHILYLTCLNGCKRYS